MTKKVHGNKYKDIYTEFIDQTELTDVDREVLKQKRGFTSGIIDELQFRSARPSNKKIINDLKEKYGNKKLIEAGLFERKKDGKILPCNQLTQKHRVIIPYIDKDNQITLLRPHKLGLKGVYVQPYCKYITNKSNNETIILAESEFKAAAMYQLNIPVIGIPGIMSFSGTHYSRLVDLLNEFNIKNVIICFDNEVKDNPEYDNYKPDPTKRYDTQYYTWLMGYKLHKSDFKTKVAVLPDSWMINGKIDLDGALAAGHTKKEFEEVFSNAVSYKSYRYSWSGEEKRILERKIKKYFYQNRKGQKIQKKKIGNYYLNKFELKSADPEKPEKELSNFIIEIKKTYKTSEGLIREVVFKNEFGEISDPFLLEPSDMSGVSSFETFCYSKGNYLWKGSNSELKMVWEYCMVHDAGKIIELPEKIGEIEPGFWLFGNIAFKDGKEYTPNKDGVFWIDGQGYLPQSLDSNCLPELETTISIKEIADYIKRLKQNLGGYGAYLGVGFIIATIFSRPIFNEFGAFPIYFSHGKRESGKTTFCRWLMKFAGLQEPDGKDISETTQNYIMRKINYYSSLPVWFDEYRNERKVNQKDGYLRSAYNRLSAGKGVKESFGAKSYDVNSSLILSGEEAPRDSGLFSRLLRQRHTANNLDKSNYNELKNNSNKFSALTYFLIKNYKKHKEDLVENIKELKKTLIKDNIEDRTALNYAIAAGSFYSIFRAENLMTKEHLQEFIEWIYSQCKDVRQGVEESHILNQFWNDVIILYDKKIIRDDHIKIYHNNKKEFIALWFNGIFNEWEQDYRKRKGKQPFEKTTIKEDLQEEKYFYESKKVWIGNATRHCYLIDTKKINGNRELKELHQVLLEELDV